MEFKKELHIPLEKLCNESVGKNLHLNAKKYKEIGEFAKSIILTVKATDFLEEEIKDKKDFSNKKKDLLEDLYACYQKLSAESFLPEQFQQLPLPEPWYYYIKKTHETKIKLNLLQLKK